MMRTRLIGTAVITALVVVGCGKKESSRNDENAVKEPVQGIVRDMVSIPGTNFKMGKYEVTQA